MRTQLLPHGKGHRSPPTFGPCLLCRPNGRPSKQLLSSCYCMYRKVTVWRTVYDRTHSQQPCTVKMISPLSKCNTGLLFAGSNTVSRVTPVCIAVGSQKRPVRSFYLVGSNQCLAFLMDHRANDLLENAPSAVLRKSSITWVSVRWNRPDTDVVTPET